MSISQRAVILIRLDARRGEVVSVTDLAAHMGLAPEVIQQRIQELWDEGWATPEWVCTDGASVITGAMAAARLPTHV